MITIRTTIYKFWVPILALVVICIHFALVKTTALNKWKGGGFGMYSEVHYYYHDIVIDNLNMPLDSIIRFDRKVANFVMDMKRSPNPENLRKMAELISKNVSGDTVNIELWKPLIDSKNSSYLRELVNRYKFIKP